MSLNITDAGASLKIEITSAVDGYPAQVVYIDKGSVNLTAQGDVVSIRDSENHFRFKYSNVTLPASANISVLLDTLHGYVNTDNVQDQILAALLALRMPPNITANEANLLGTPATGTITVVDYTALVGKTVTVAGQVLTEGVEWEAAVSNHATALSIAAAINALVEVSASVAIGSGAITVRGKYVFDSDLITLATSDVINLTISGATLSGEVDPVDGLLIYVNTINADFPAVGFYGTEAGAWVKL